MAFLNHGPSKSESPDKTPYTIYYPHTIPVQQRNWSEPYLEFVSIDPARKNYALRIERRYKNGWICPIVFDKVSIQDEISMNDTTISRTYQNLTTFLDKYRQFYDECHFIVFERQLPQNYKASRVAQHTLTYFTLLLHNKPLLPTIIEIDAKVKGRILGWQKGTDLKQWAVEYARKLLTQRKDDYSLQVMNGIPKKQDDLADTVCQIEALMISWGFEATKDAPNSHSQEDTFANKQDLAHVLAPVMIIKKHQTPKVLPAKPGMMLSFIQTAPQRPQSLSLVIKS